MKKNKSFLINVDMDSFSSLAEYYGIGAPQEGNDLMYEIAIPRMLELFRKFNLKATFFICGKDFVGSENTRSYIKDILKEGHHLANHSFSHRYGLSSLSPEIIESEIGKNHEIIKSYFNFECAGFRAPGFNISNLIIDILSKKGYLYDSSQFLTNLEFFYKLYHRILVTGKKKKVSGGFGHNFTFKSSREPYLIHSGKDKLERFLEIPIATSRILKIPCYFNFHLIFGRKMIRHFLKGLDLECANYLFHGVDFVDFYKDKLDEKFSAIINIKKPIDLKIASFKEVIDGFLKGNYSNILASDFARNFNA